MSAHLVWISCVSGAVCADEEPEPSEYGNLDMGGTDQSSKTGGSTKTGSRGTTRPRKPKPAPEERVIAEISPNRYNSTAMTYRILTATDDTLDEYARKIKEKTGLRFGKGRILDEMIATFGDEYIKLKLKSL